MAGATSSKRLSPEQISKLFVPEEPDPHADVTNWRVDYWQLSDNDAFRFLLDAVRQCGILDDLHVPQNNIFYFFHAVKATYRNVPFHNFRHALSTLHFAFKLFHTSNTSQQLTVPDRFAILIAALCHDCDHRGCNNAFEVRSRSELALRYNDSSPLENHHCARTFEIILGSANASCNIFEAVSTETFFQLRKHIIAGILATDMQHHGDHVSLLQSFVLQPGHADSQSQYLVELFLHTADISNPFMPHDISVRWSKLVAEEFTQQVDQEKDLGLPVTSFMTGLSDVTAAAKSQMGFIDFVIVPLTDPLFRIFSGFESPGRFLAYNRKAVQAIVDETKSPFPSENQ